MFQFSVALNVILTTYEVPHEITPVHPVYLIGEEELYVLPHGRDVDRLYFTTLLISNVLSLDIHPGFIELRMIEWRAVHAGEQHVLRIFVFQASRNLYIAVRLVFVILFLAYPLELLLSYYWFAIAVFLLKLHFRSEGRTIEQRAGAILLTT